MPHIENAYPDGTINGLVSVPVVPTGLGPNKPPTVRPYKITITIIANNEASNLFLIESK